ncbi:hypothetical protein HDU91_007425 [Kappamyces sp. JEL0680]|nr:hypothetical protein HDU91_007425 [Kappamyces sp. JEL0680]
MTYPCLSPSGKRPSYVLYDPTALYPSPVQEKKIRLDLNYDLPFEKECAPVAIQRPATPQSPIFLPPVMSLPIMNPAAPLPAQLRPIVQAKKPKVPAPLPKEMPLELPTRIESDNGKRSWELIKSIGKGGCGEVYLGRELHSPVPGPLVAVKIIKVASLAHRQDRKQFVSELATMKTLNEHRHGRGTPATLTLGFTPKLLLALKKKKTLVMEYLSDTVATRFERCGYKFSLKTICMLAMNMVATETADR